MFELTEAQQKRLDAFPEDTKVVGKGRWGPIVKRADGSFREVTPQGRLRRGNAVDQLGELSSTTARVHTFLVGRLQLLSRVHEQHDKA